MNTANAPTGKKKPDGTLTTQTENQTFIMQVFFDPDSKETFQDKLLRVIFAEKLTVLHPQCPVEVIWGWSERSERQPHFTATSIVAYGDLRRSVALHSPSMQGACGTACCTSCPRRRRSAYI